jgi:signal peptidase I
VVIVALAVGLALGIQQWLVKPFQIPSPSMVPTLEENQRILVNRFLYSFEDPEIGDIVVFNPPAGATGGGPQCVRTVARLCVEGSPEPSEDNFVKRIVAGPGDRLRIARGHPIVNGEQVDGSYAQPCNDPSICTFREEITIPPDHYFMMGDNRPASDDSRVWGPVPRDWFIGQAFFTYWPVDKIGVF